MKKSLSTILLGLLTVSALAGCGNNTADTKASYVDLTAESIYGRLTDFSSETVKAGDTLTFTVRPSQYFFVEGVTNNGKRCKLVTQNEDGTAVYSTTITAGVNKLSGSYSVDPAIDFVDKFKLDISDEVFDEVMSKTEAKNGDRTELDFRKSGIEQVRAPNKFDSSGKKVARSSKEVFLNYVDGDTTHVETYNLQYTVKIRYLSIDTPESTSEIEEWGLTASYYSKYIYTGNDEYKSYIKSTTDLSTVQAGATSIILVSQAASINSSTMTKADLNIGKTENGPYAATTDGNQRNLAYVWYATKQNPTKNDFRCLNLEMVYQGFSFGVGSADDTSDYYYRMFDAANLSAQANRRHIYSTDTQSDPNYYYYETKGVSNLSLKKLYESAEKDDTIGYYPVSQFANKKTLYRVKGFVSRKVGTSFYIQDKKEYDNDAVIAGTETPYGIYVFTYSETPIRVGDEVEVVGAVSSYGGTFQMQGITFSTISPDPVRDTIIVTRGNTIKPVKVTGEQFNSLKLPQILVEITDNVWFYQFTSTYQGVAEDIGEGGSEEVNKYNTAYPFYNTSNSPIFYGSFGATDNAASINSSESNIRYSNKIIRFTVDQNILVNYGITTAYSYQFFTGGSYWYNVAGAEYASAEYAPEAKPADCSEEEAYKYQAVLKTFKRKSCQPEVAGHGLIVISHGYESTSGNTKMTATICSGSARDISLTELD
ncbi:MAG: hypothetical protein J6M95_03355 [Bacilli bacterium]|nr:hypothetical protein [Bacilli bacterium]